MDKWIGRELLEQYSRTSVHWIFILMATYLCTTSAWAGSTASFHIPAGKASDSLQEFYQQSQVRVLFLTDTVKGVETQQVDGEFEASEALGRLLQGTTLTFKLEGETAVIKSAPRAVSSGSGDVVPPLYDLRGATLLEEVLVTGSLIHGVLDIASPLVVMEKKEIEKANYATVQDTVRTLPVAATITRGEVFGGTSNYNHGSGINLRGLGDGATLVLVNGRRQAMSGREADFVDVSTIPSSMVDHIELLPDGGSALYGSDAIAGVVNIILRQDMEGAETKVRYGSARDGAAELTAAQLLGHNWTGGHWLAGYQYYEHTTLTASDRNFTANADKRSLGGTDHRSLASSPGNILNSQTLQPMYAIPGGQDGAKLTIGQLLPGAANYRNQFAGVDLLPGVRMHSVYGIGSLDVSERVDLFAEARFSQRDMTMQVWSPDMSPLLVPSTNPFYVNPFGGSSSVAVAYDYSKDFGMHRSEGRNRDFAGTVGVKSRFSDTWQASLSTSFGQDSSYTALTGSADLSALNRALADSNPATAFNPFGDGPNTNPATIATIKQRTWLKSISNIPSVQVLADGPFFEMPSGAVKIAVGAEYREEYFFKSSRVQSSNMQTTTNSQLDRQIVAAYSELSIPVLGNFANPRAVPKLELSVAGRFEHYSDFGQTVNPKIGLRWTPITALKLRSSWGTSFKAPKMTDLTDDANTMSGLGSLKDPRSPTGRSIVLGTQGANPDLKEERATTWTAGIDLAPQVLAGFQASLTGYSVDYKDQVIQPGPPNPVDILLQEDQWAAVIVRNPSQSFIDSICDGPKFFGNPTQCRTTHPTVYIDYRKHNLAITRVTGVDLTINQLLNTNHGNFNFDVTGSYAFHFEQEFTNTAPVVDILDTAYNPLALRVRGRIEWDQHGAHQPGFAASFTTNYAGGYKDPDSTVRGAIDALTTFDFWLSYTTARRTDILGDTEWAFNVVNVTNTAPPFVDREWGFDIVNAQPSGRVISVSFAKRWQ